MRVANHAGLRRVGSGRAFVVEVGYAENEKAQTVPLLSNEEHVADLWLQLFLILDHRATYLAVEKSTIMLQVGRLPVLRLDYQRDMHTAPAAHWNVHAERSAITRMITRKFPERSGELSTVHLPVGGERMRPCVEDVLQLLVVDFGFDVLPGWEEALREGRRGWRERQVAALVRDMPDVAARVLEDLHYAVTPPAEQPATGERRDRTLHTW